MTPRSRRNLKLVIALLVGAIIGVGSFTFSYGEGLSYFSTDPAACANCHVMNEHYDSWTKGPHHFAATCVECHLPHDFVGKYIAKADNGYRHSKAFTLMDFAEPIRITPRNSRILQDNCVRCHGQLVHDLLSDARQAPGGSAGCVHCHTDVGHGARGWQAITSTSRQAHDHP
jgi:cytochrome c nitrite reductase small subunit